MKFHFIFPRWPKIPEQTPYELPPLGYIQAAACVPEGIEVGATNDHVQEVDLDGDFDLVGISLMLSCQAPRAYELAKEFKARGKTVVLGGQHVKLCPEEASQHADSIVVGEAEGVLERLVEDFQAGKLKKRYEREKFTQAGMIPFPRRDLLKKEELYTIRGWEMVDLLQTSRGCRFKCYPCSVYYLEGGEHRVWDLDHTVADAEQCSERIFIVDNSMDQNVPYQKELMSALAGLGKRFISHPIHPSHEVLKLAQKAGWWYVYLAIFKISEKVRERIKMYHEYGIGVEGTIMLGIDEQDEDAIRRLVDFLLDIDLDLAEFTILTPFPHTRTWKQLEEEGRIIDRDWSHYNASNVVFKPAQMTPEKLQELYEEAWKTFYAKESQELKMGKLLLNVLKSSRKRRRALGKES